MIFAKNIAAFRTIRRAHGVGLIAKCYCQCVYLELCLKTDSSLLRHNGTGHAIPSMLRHVSCMSATSGRQLTSLASRLENRLRSLKQHSKNMAIQSVDPSNHPHLRYLCHANDAIAPATGSSDAELTDLLSILDQITLLLRSPNTALPV